jgi:hypothetical protein
MIAAPAKSPQTIRLPGSGRFSTGVCEKLPAPPPTNVSAVSIVCDWTAPFPAKSPAIVNQDTPAGSTEVK